MRCRRRVAWGAGGSLVAAAATNAFAQDYSVTSATGLYESPPANAATLTAWPNQNGGGGPGDDDSTGQSVALPFDFLYFGTSYDTCSVSSNGFLQLGTGSSTNYSPAAFPLSGGDDGIIAPYWDDLMLIARSSVRTWTSGTAPNRKFVVSWERDSMYWDRNADLTFQAQLFETSGRIVFAYAPGGNYALNSQQWYSVGIDAVSPDNRWAEPPGVSNPNNTGRPPNDWVFDPARTTYTGRILYDRLVSDASGIGNAVESSLPLAGLRVELRRPNGKAAGIGYADANGDFTVQGVALIASETGSMVVAAAGPSCRVRAGSPGAAGATYAFAIQSAVAFSGGGNLGTYTIGSGVDPGGTNREPLHVARAIQQAYDKVRQVSADGVPPLDVYYDASATEATSYTKAGANPAWMRVASAGTSNPDAWDSGVVRRTYAHHVLGAIAGAQSTGFSSTFDGVTDDQNAFAEGFGCWLQAVLSGERYLYDGVDSDTGSAIDLEDPQPSTRKGPDVAAWVAAALFDLVDAANEDWDEVDGGSGGAADRVLQAADALTAAPTAASFHRKWGELGLAGGPALSRNFIHHGLLGDDVYEPNDGAAEATVFPVAGFRRSAVILNPYNEDWFQFQLAAGTTSLTAAVAYNRALVNATVTLEIRDMAGSVVATGQPLPNNGPVQASTGAVPAGTYRVRVRHDAGVRIDPYTVQAYAPLELSADSFRPWTVGFAYDVPVDVKGGVPPYTLTVEQPFVKPPGLLLDSANVRVTGAPTQVGKFDFMLTVRDDASPNNLASVLQSFTVNDRLDLGLGAFVAFPYNRPLDRQAPFTGGTPPYRFTLGAGALPHGIDLALDSLRLQGTADVPGSAPFHVDGIDVAGSADAADTLGVVCVPFAGKATPANLAAGSAACGWFFDAVSGTAASVSAKTAKKQPKRTLRAVVQGPTGAEVTDLTVKAGLGKATLTGIRCTSTGRWYAVVASDVGDPSQLLGALKLAPPKAASGSDENFAPGDTVVVEIGALAGAHATLTATPDKASGLELRAQLLRDPTGASVPIAAEELVAKGKGFVWNRDLATAGTWRFTIGAKPGAQGRLVWKLKIKQPKGGVYSAD